MALIAHTTVITVPTAGTPVRWTADESIMAKAFLIVNPHASDKAYVGLAGMNKTTGNQCIAPLAAGAAFQFAGLAGEGTRKHRIADYWFDVTTNGSTVLATYWTET